MTTKYKQAVLAPQLRDGVSMLALESLGTGVTGIDSVLLPRKLRLTLSGFTIAVLAANDYGGTKVIDLAFSNLLILGIEVDTVVTKQGNTNGVVATTDITMAMGTAVASNATLSGAMIDIIEATSITTDALAVDFEKHTNDQGTATFPKKIADGASSALYMNYAGAITADSSVTVDGYINIYYIDLGKMA